MSTSGFEITDTEWIDVQAQAGIASNTTYSIQCVGGKHIYFRTASSPPPIEDRGFILAVGSLPYFFRLETLNLYVRASSDVSVFAFDDNNPFGV